MSSKDNLAAKAQRLFRSLCAVYDTSISGETASMAAVQTHAEEIKAAFGATVEQLEEVNHTLPVEERYDIVPLFDDFMHKYYGLALAQHTSTPLGEQAGGSVQNEDLNGSNIISRANVGRNEGRIVELPKIVIAPFGGRIEEYESFRNLFDNLIHNNSNLDNVRKFQYLLSLLRDDARQLVAHLAISPSNYTLAYSLLNARYASQRVLLDQHFNMIVSFTAHEDPIKHLSDFLSVHSGAKVLFEKSEDAADYLLFRLAYKNIPSSMRADFENTIEAEAIPKMADLLKFATRRLRALESVASGLESFPEGRDSQRAIKSRESNPKITFGHKQQYRSFVAVHQSSMRRAGIERVSYGRANTAKCPVCQNPSHKIYGCFVFSGMAVSERRDFVKKYNRCENCLGRHDLKDCRSGRSCLGCGQHHHSSLCAKILPEGRSKVVGSSGDGVEQVLRVTDPAGDDGERVTETAKVFSIEAAHQGSNSLLGTILIHCIDNFGQVRVLRFIADSGSDRTLLTRTAADLLALPLKPAQISLQGIGGGCSSVVATVELCLRTLPPHNKVLTTSALVVPEISGKLPRTSIDARIALSLSHLELADRWFYESRPVDGLIGIDVLAGALVKGVQVNCGSGTLNVWRTCFGDVILGALPEEFVAPFRLQASSYFVTSSLEFRGDSEKPREGPDLAEEEDFCEELFQRTTEKVGCRFQVRLPFRESPVPVGNSRGAAFKIFLALENKLSRADPMVQRKFHEFMRDFIEKQYMSEATQPGEYLVPYHYLFKPSYEEGKEGKMRVVFNFSFKASNRRSLNDLLYQGPNLLAEIPELVTKFRTRKFYLICDIKQMYLRILLHPQDRKLQHIFYRSAPGAPVKEYQLNILSFGINCAPYLAIRTLRRLAEESEMEFPEACRVIRNQTFMDDAFILGSSTEEILEVREQLIQAMKKGGFALAKYAASDPVMLKGLPPEAIASGESKFLGLRVHSSTDSMSIKVPTFDSEVVTKRVILQYVQSIFDPLGFLIAPLLAAKLFLQRLWELRMAWDAVLPAELIEGWGHVVRDFPLLNQVYVPRCFGEGGRRRLVGFADASLSTMVSALYLHTDMPEGGVIVQLVAARSRVASSKGYTVPRGELSAACMLAEMYRKYRSAVPEVNIQETLLCTDSQITWYRIKNDADKREIYVRNRITKLRENSPSEFWHFIPGTLNIADLPTRCLTPREFLSRQDEWFGGNEFMRAPYLELCERIKKWHPGVTEDSSAGLPVERVAQCNLLTLEEELFVNRFSSLRTLLHVTAYVLRFIARVRGESTSPLIKGAQENLPSESLSLSCGELRNAERACVFMTQNVYFAGKIDLLKKGQVAREWRQLTPHIDEFSILRLGGRLQCSPLPYDTRHPYMLPKEAHLSNLLIWEAHKRALHAGPQITRSIVRRKYWIQSATTLVKKLLRNCTTCGRYSKRACTPIMAPLPPQRVSVCERVFAVTHVDLAGPIPYRPSLVRGNKSLKSWIVVFVCASVRAVHLELLSSLSTDSFLAAFHRFTNRRGSPRVVITDRGTNFVGANRELKEAYQFLRSQDVFSLLADEQVEWRFLPTGAPHHGGLHEAAVREAKRLLLRVLGTQVLTFEELYTLISRVEGILNSRPLVDFSTDLNEDVYLTASHFLTGGAHAAVSEQPISKEESLRSRWKLVRAMSHQFWAKYRNYYLNLLASRSKWYKSLNPLKVGDVVLVRKINCGPLSWPLGRITALLPNKTDKVARVAKVRVGQTEFVRAVQHLLPLVSVEEERSEEASANAAQGSSDIDD